MVGSLAFFANIRLLDRLNYYGTELNLYVKSFRRFPGITSGLKMYNSIGFFD